MCSVLEQVDEKTKKRSANPSFTQKHVTYHGNINFSAPCHVNSQRLSNDGCLEVKMEDYKNCSVLDFVLFSEMIWTYVAGLWPLKWLTFMFVAAEESTASPVKKKKKKKREFDPNLAIADADYKVRFWIVTVSISVYSAT